MIKNWSLQLITLELYRLQEEANDDEVENKKSSSSSLIQVLSSLQKLYICIG